MGAKKRDFPEFSGRRFYFFGGGSNFEVPRFDDGKKGYDKQKRPLTFWTLFRRVLQ
ncbi:hypothetical protein ['Paenibacillus yunnanensis' Narsing Rao et al. 2020]|uniref:hypothetical protein n=1 Tax=Paenibacillus tengchongensis TaxID=2608684 RepID=UPI0016523F59|nr:hypothetical protein [Paenibacillus tengchongensis]